METRSSTRTESTGWPGGVGTEEQGGLLPCLRRVGRHAHEAGFPALSHGNERLEHDRAAELLCQPGRLLHTSRDAASGDGNTFVLQKRLGRVFVEIHGLMTIGPPDHPDNDEDSRPTDLVRSEPVSESFVRHGSRSRNAYKVMLSETLLPPQVPAARESVKSRPFSKSPPFPMQWA